MEFEPAATVITAKKKVVWMVEHYGMHMDSISLYFGEPLLVTTCPPLTTFSGGLVMTSLTHMTSNTKVHRDIVEKEPGAASLSEDYIYIMFINRYLMIRAADKCS